MCKAEGLILKVVWSTALESAYPKPLAVAWATCASQAWFGPHPQPLTDHQRKRAMFEPAFERRERIAAEEIRSWGPLSPAMPAARPSQTCQRRQDHPLAGQKQPF